MKNIKVYSWKPKAGKNFGDEIGPMIVSRICAEFGLDLHVTETNSEAAEKLLCVGSIIHEARGRDVIWGAGVNGRVWPSQLAHNKEITFLAVRGPVTREIVTRMGFDCPEIFGDPGLLFATLFNFEIRSRVSELQLAYECIGKEMPSVIFIPNTNDERFLPRLDRRIEFEDVFSISPFLDPVTIAAYISAADLVISSSLHGLVFADALRRPSVRVASMFEPELKYADYYEGTNRALAKAHHSVFDALQADPIAEMKWSSAALIEAFPFSMANAALHSHLIKDLPVLTEGESFEVGDMQDASLFASGWSEKANGSVWSIENPAELQFAILKKKDGPKVLKLAIGTLERGRAHYEKVRAIIDGNIVLSQSITRGKGSVSMEIPLPDKAFGAEYSVLLRMENPSIPRDHGLGDDARELGIWVSSVEIQEN